MIHTEIELWKKLNNTDLTIGSMVYVEPSCEYYEAEYDAGTKYMVVLLCVDSGGLNIGLNDGYNKSFCICESDGYRIYDLKPVQS